MFNTPSLIFFVYTLSVYLHFFSESVHSDYEQTWKFYKVHEKKPSHAEQRRKSVVKHIVKHLRNFENCHKI